MNRIPFCRALAAIVAIVVAPQAIGQPRLEDLAPIQLYAVPEVDVAPPVPLPEASADAASFWLDEQEAAPDMALDLFALPGIGRSKKLSASSPGLWGTSRMSVTGWRRAPRLRRSWLPRTSDDPWTFGARNWRYAADNGMDVILGSEEVDVPLWGSSVRLGGVSVSHASRVDGGGAGRWRYSLAVGALDYSADQTQGDLTYGPTAGNTVLQYGVSPQFTLESQLEMAPQLLTSGIGGRYDSQGWGVWSAGVSRANTGLYKGWRYQTAYDVDVTEDLKLSWVNERRGEGYADLSGYRDRGNTAAQVRQEWSATVPMGRFGDLSGVYARSHDSLGETQRSFGLTQQFWYSPNLRVALKAEREVVTGDYDVGIRFSVPVF